MFMPHYACEGQRTAFRSQFSSSVPVRDGLLGFALVGTPSFSCCPPLSPQGSETADAVTTYGFSTWVPELNSDPEPPQQGLFPAEPSRRLNRTLKKSL